MSRSDNGSGISSVSNKGTSKPKPKHDQLRQLPASPPNDQYSGRQLQPQQDEQDCLCSNTTIPKHESIPYDENSTTQPLTMQQKFQQSTTSSQYKCCTLHHGDGDCCCCNVYEFSTRQKYDSTTHSRHQHQRRRANRILHHLVRGTLLTITITLCTILLLLRWQIHSNRRTLPSSDLSPSNVTTSCAMTKQITNDSPILQKPQQQQQQQRLDGVSNNIMARSNQAQDYKIYIDAGSNEGTTVSFEADDANDTNRRTIVQTWLPDTYYSGGIQAHIRPELVPSNQTIVLETIQNGNSVIKNNILITNSSSSSSSSIHTRTKEEMMIVETYRRGSIWMGNTIRYEIPVRNGIYNVTFYFVEYDANIRTGDRIFDIHIEDDPQYTISKIDVWNITTLYRERNDSIPTIQISTSNLMVRDGALTIDFRPNMDKLPKWAMLRRFIRRLRAKSPFVSGIVVSLVSTDVGNPKATLAPIGPPVAAPVSIGPPTTLFKTIRINAGSTIPYTDIYGNNWLPDTYFTDGMPVLLDTTTDDVSATPIIIPPSYSIDSSVLGSARTGVKFRYNIIVPPGNYDIRLYFVEYNTTVGIGQRLFDIRIETVVQYQNVDITALANGVVRTAVLLSKPYEIIDGDVTIDFVATTPQRFLPTLSAIEIVLLGVHYAHAVSGGPYRGVINPNTGLATIMVNANPSHTHAPGLELVDWVWKLVPSFLSTNGTMIGRGELTSLSLPVGEHIVVLTVTDNGGNDSKETTTVTIYGAEYPDVTGITPKNGPIFGGNFVTIVGSGFLYPSNVTIVQFGTQNITGSRIQILNANNIKLRVPSVMLPSLTAVSVITPKGESKSALYSYESSVPIRFNSAKLFDIEKPIRVRFGPDGKLYVSNGIGQITKLTLDDNYRIVDKIVAQVTTSDRYITGLAFDPIDADPTRIYFVHNRFFHGCWKSTSGLCISGKVSAASGSNLNVVTDIITGLPVADLDHGIMAIEFGDSGELYIGAGSNTNGGIPGPLTSKSLQKDTVLNSAILVAYLSKPGFNGTITYDAEDDGNQIGALGFVEVYAPGVRNPFGMVLHSNGNLYVTDNGPNLAYGAMAMGCKGESIPDTEEEDRLHLIEKGKYYGQPNLKRGQIDSRQCTWRRATELRTTNNGYTPPIGRPLSSTTGVIEFQSNHFDGQLRSSLFTVLYKGGLYRTILSADGRSVLPESIPPVLITGEGALDITQGPDGTIVDTRYLAQSVFYYKPFEFFVSNVPTILSVFPRRGSVNGGTILTLYGYNLWTGSSNTKILMGNNECILGTTSFAPTSNKLQCIIPPHDNLNDHTTVDIVAIVTTFPNNNATLQRGYRYIVGKPIV
jgi:Malectin domain/Glucose / Sorbosone dehydrogenase/IPT/TIG domain